ncbi:MAG: hypothetical protein MUE53_01400 [Chitinophagales bacterium]|jgi:hypothetical protein|nr:hypothetical protein [Chitinophagales bacterium]
MFSKFSFYFRLFLFTILVSSFNSCERETPTTVYTAPINLLEPTQDISYLKLGNSFPYRLVLRASSSVDSLQIFYQIDSTNQNQYNHSLEKYVRTHTFENPSNQREISDKVDFPANSGLKFNHAIRYRFIMFTKSSQTYEKYIRVIFN